MQLNKRRQDQVHFANFCKINDLDPLGVAELMTLSDLRCKIAEREHNEPNFPEEKDDKARKAVEDKAAELGLRVDLWPGLYPSLKDKDGQTIGLPY